MNRNQQLVLAIANADLRHRGFQGVELGLSFDEIHRASGLPAYELRKLLDEGRDYEQLPGGRYRLTRIGHVFLRQLGLVFPDARNVCRRLLEHLVERARHGGTRTPIRFRDLVTFLGALDEGLVEYALVILRGVNYLDSIPVRLEAEAEVRMSQTIEMFFTVPIEGIRVFEWDLDVDLGVSGDALREEGMRLLGAMRSGAPPSPAPRW